MASLKEMRNKEQIYLGRLKEMRNTKEMLLASLKRRDYTRNLFFNWSIKLDVL
jgi:tRNA G10  N-methylase Trm11